MGNSVTGPGARLDAERDNLHAYCDRLEAENATLREQLAAAPGATLAGGTMVDDITPDQLAADLARCEETKGQGYSQLAIAETWADKLRPYIHALRNARARIAELEGAQRLNVSVLAQRLAEVERDNAELKEENAQVNYFRDSDSDELAMLRVENADLRRQLDEAQALQVIAIQALAFRQSQGDERNYIAHGPTYDRLIGMIDERLAAARRVEGAKCG